jgi:hypothetical protein
MIWHPVLLKMIKGNINVKQSIENHIQLLQGSINNNNNITIIGDTHHISITGDCLIIDEFD